MTRKDLAENINAFETGNRKREWPLVLVFLAGIVLLGIFGAKVADDSMLLGTLALMLMLVWIVGTAWIAIRTNNKRVKDLCLLCPSCGTNLAGPTGRLAVATTYCSHCGTQILEDAATSAGSAS
ncbi:MAG: DUF2614 family zinc ribbon-containing protein [Prosthecobacter sp.]|nr:DUF2614 family zinc ribbon-containing protein [Prosthecobacter sp.]